MNNPFMERWSLIEERAELLRALAHPARLCIVLGLLQKGCCNVNKMQKELDMPQSTLSQHLARLKTAGIIKGERIGTEVHYRVINHMAAKVALQLWESS